MMTAFKDAAIDDNPSGDEGLKVKEMSRRGFSCGNCRRLATMPKNRFYVYAKEEKMSENSDD
jgi:hypothetical protein